MDRPGDPAAAAAWSEVSDPDLLVRDPLVSVLMVTYQHERWIGQAIAGIVGQEHVPGGFELIIGEDCSTDATRDIVLDWQRRHPGLIRVLLPSRNVGPGTNHHRVIAAARGRLLAFCEGDDFWCDPGKLADQVALMQEPDVGAVHTDWVRTRRVGDDEWRQDARSVHCGMPQTLLEGKLFAHFDDPRLLRTCTLMLRAHALRQYFEDSLARHAYRFEDTVIAAFITSCWRVAYLPRVTAVYRESPGSLLRSGLDARIAFLRSALDFDRDARERFAGRADYPVAYRWRISAGLIVFGIRARRLGAIRLGMAELWRTYGVLGAVAMGARVLGSKLRRQLPAAAADA